MFSKIFKPVLQHTAELRQQVEQYKKKYHHIDDTISIIQKNETRQENIINYQTEQITKLILQNDQCKDTVRDKNGQIKTLESQIELINKVNKFEHEQTNSEIAKLKSELNDKNDLIDSSQNEITLLKSESEIFAREVNLKITLLTSDLEVKNEQISEYRQKMKENTAESCLEYGYSNDLQVFKIPGIGPFVAPCESRIAGPGWMVIQRRIDGNIDFKRKWEDYKHGFGDLNGEFWLGLERIYKLTRSRRYELYVHMVNLTDHVLYSRYDAFEIGSETEHYKLKPLGEYQGTIRDSLRYNEGIEFTTFDRDNDANSDKNLASFFGGAWWHIYPARRWVKNHIY